MHTGLRLLPRLRLHLRLCLRRCSWLRWPWRRRQGPMSLTTRVSLTVLAGFALVFFVLVAVISQNTLGSETGDLDRALLQSTESMVRTLDAEDSEESARIFVRFMSHGVGEVTDDPPLRVVAYKLSNQRQFAPPLLQWLNASSLRDGVQTLPHEGTQWRLYTVTGKAWRVTAVDDAGARKESVLRSLGVDIAMYLLLAVPFVLIPVWLSVRSGLAPLRRLSQTVAARLPQDMTPLPDTASYSELQPLQKALNLQFTQAAQSILRERAFVHDAAHELRTPLAVIATQAHVLAHSSGADRDAASQRLQAAVTRASHLSQQLLRLAQTDAATRVAPEPVDLMNLVRNTMAAMAERAQAQGTELDLQGPDHLHMLASETALRSIIENLLDNALRYGGPLGVVSVDVQVDVQVEGQADAQTVHLRVKDLGPGIRPEQHKQAFERFWRGAHPGQPGSGLGLSIVREAARALGGDVHIESGQPGEGCTVRVVLLTRPAPVPPPVQLPVQP